MLLEKRLFAAVIEDDEGNQRVVECPSVGHLIDEDYESVVKELEYWKDIGVLERHANYKIIQVQIVRI